MHTNVIVHTAHLQEVLDELVPLRIRAEAEKQRKPVVMESVSTFGLFPISITPFHSGSIPFHSGSIPFSLLYSIPFYLLGFQVVILKMARALVQFIFDLFHCLS